MSFRCVAGCFLTVIIAMLLGSCGSNHAPSRPQARFFDLAVSGQTVTKARTGGAEIVVLEERLTSLFEDGPQRTLLILHSDTNHKQLYASPSGWSLVDFTVHPSGEISAILTTARDVRIVRLDTTGSIRSDQPFLDSDAALDPFFNYEGGIKDDTALQPALMHDAARLAPLGESLAVVLRTGRNAIVAYRLDPDSNGVYRRSWRTLVEPGSSILGIGLTGGTFDVFGQLQNHLRIQVDVAADAPDTLAIGVVNAQESNFTFRAHSDYFGEPIAATAGVLVTRLSSLDGRRLGSTVIDTHVRSELHGLRATPSGFVLVGRVLSEVRSDGSGWDAFTALVRRDGTLEAYHLIDVDRGDILFDIARLPSGRILALGTTGYVQNPSGASISEAAQPLLVLLNADGSLAQNLGYVSGLRHNQLTTITRFNDHWLLGGMVNGPGTHSGDTDRGLIVANGFLREVPGLPEN